MKKCFAVSFIIITCALFLVWAAGAKTYTVNLPTPVTATNTIATVQARILEQPTDWDSVSTNTVYTFRVRLFDAVSTNGVTGGSYDPLVTFTVADILADEGQTLDAWNNATKAQRVAAIKRRLRKAINAAWQAVWQ